MLVCGVRNFAILVCEMGFMIWSAFELKHSDELNAWGPVINYVRRTRGSESEDESVQLCVGKEGELFAYA